MNVSLFYASKMVSLYQYTCLSMQLYSVNTYTEYVTPYVTDFNNFFYAYNSEKFIYRGKSI